MWLMEELLFGSGTDLLLMMKELVSKDVDKY